MPRLKGEPWDTARTLFEPTKGKNDRPRCQAFSQQRVESLREKYMGNDEEIPVEEAVLAQCRQTVSKDGFTVCRVHGAGNPGNQPGRPVVTGRHSKYLPTDLQARYEQALEDSDLIALREEMALVRTRITELLELSDGINLGELEDAVISLGHALKAGDMGAAQDEYLRMVEIIQTTKGQWGAWKEIAKLVELRRKLSVSEVGRLQALNQMLTVQQAMVLLATVTDIIITADIPEQVKKSVAGQLRKIAQSSSS